jgi:CBS domain-containing protein
LWLVALNDRLEANGRTKLWVFGRRVKSAFSRFAPRLAGRTVGFLDRANILQSVKQAGLDAPVADAMTASPVLTVGCRAPLEQALRLMQQNSAATVAVTDAAGKLVGLVTSDMIAEMMTLAMLQKERAGGAPLAWRSRPSGMR